MEEIIEYVKPELLILIPVLYLLGKGLKNSTVKNKFIPFAVGAAGILLSLTYVLSTEELLGWSQWLGSIFTAVTQGILAAGGSVYFDQLIKQWKKEE